MPAPHRPIDDPAPAGALDLVPGPWDPDTDDRVSDIAGPLLVVRGVVFVDATILGVQATELLGPGDLFPLDGRRGADDPVGETSMSVFSAARVFILDSRLEAVVTQRPTLGAQLIAAAAENKRLQVLHRALSQLPRIEDRVLGMLWVMARRWGTMGPDGAVLEFEGMTHALLGRLIGGARASVTMAVRSLEQDGLVRRDGKRYVLARGSWPS